LENKNLDLIAMSQVTKVSKVTFMCLCNGSSEAFRSLKNSSTEPEELRWHRVMAWPGELGWRLRWATVKGLVVCGGGARWWPSDWVFESQRRGLESKM
jgi:hypothetical protein